MYKNLSHLTEEEIDSLMERYYAGESTKKLLSEYNLSVPTSQLYKLFPPIDEYDDYFCEYCGINLVADRKPKTNNTYYKSDLYCPKCNHKPYISKCSCSNCKARAQEEHEQQLQKIKEVYSKKPNQVSFSNIDFENRVFLGALCNLLLAENMYEIMPYAEKPQRIPLAPTDDFTYAIYRSLLRANIIAVSPRSPIAAFEQSDNFPNTYYLDKVAYDVNLRQHRTNSV